MRPEPDHFRGARGGIGRWLGVVLDDPDRHIVRRASWSHTARDRVRITFGARHFGSDIGRNLGDRSHGSSGPAAQHVLAAVLGASGSSRWSNATSTLATATNGGLIIATPDGHSVEVGIRPANRLTFSPLLTASPTQSSWTTGVLPAGLAADNSALATDSLSGSSAALVNDGDGVRAVERGGLSTWQTLTTETVLASSSAGRQCGLHFITAVGYNGTQALIGGGCRHAGAVAFPEAQTDGALSDPPFHDNSTMAAST